MKLILVVIALIILPIKSFSSVVTNVKIERVHIYKLPAPTGGVFLTISGNGRADDPCSGSDKQYFINLNDQPRGALLYSHAMTAMKDNLNVTIQGSNKCDGHASVETIDDLQVFK